MRTPDVTSFQLLLHLIQAGFRRTYRTLSGGLKNHNLFRRDRIMEPALWINPQPLVLVISRNHGSSYQLPGRYGGTQRSSDGDPQIYQRNLAGKSMELSRDFNDVGIWRATRKHQFFRVIIGFRTTSQNSRGNPAWLGGSLPCYRNTNPLK